jgi:hypothetical protein
MPDAPSQMRLSLSAAPFFLHRFSAEANSQTAVGVLGENACPSGQTPLYVPPLPPVWFVATGDVVPVRSIPDIDLMEVMQRI